MRVKLWKLGPFSPLVTEKIKTAAYLVCNFP